MEIQETTTVPEILEGIQMFFIILGILYILIWLLFLWLGNSAFSWPKTKGTIMISEELQVLRSTNVFPRILYRYSVNNKVIQSRIIFIGHFLAHTPTDYCQKITARYPKDTEVTVYYHPSFPKLSVLEPGSNNRLTISMANKLILLGICIALTSMETLKIIYNLINS